MSFWGGIASIAGNIGGELFNAWESNERADDVSDAYTAASERNNRTNLAVYQDIVQRSLPQQIAGAQATGLSLAADGIDPSLYYTTAQDTIRDTATGESAVGDLAYRENSGGGTVSYANDVRNTPRSGYDYEGYVDRYEDLGAAYSGLRPQDIASIIDTGGDADGNGSIDRGEYGRWHYGAMGQGEGRAVDELSTPVDNAFSQIGASAGEGATSSTPANGLQGWGSSDWRGAFEGSGDYQTSIPLTETNINQLNGQLSATGQSLSGAQQMEASRILKRNENNAYNNWRARLAGTAAGGAGATSAINNATQNYGAGRVAANGLRAQGDIYEAENYVNPWAAVGRGVTQGASNAGWI